MMWAVETQPLAWPLREPFRISRGVETVAHTLMVTITDEAGRRGRGESCGVNYHGETPATIAADIAGVAATLAKGVSRAELAALLPPGGARAALDAALWDLEAKRSGVPAWRAAGLASLGSVETLFSIGIRDLDGYTRTARDHAHFGVLKIKVADDDPLAAIRAVRAGAPDSRLVVDANQAWSCARLKELAPVLAELGVDLLEQPIPAGDEDGLEGYRCPVPLAADEAVQHRGDIARAARFYDIVNIKLDKTGGLTEALALADAAEAAGMGLMVGCMLGSSLSIAPAHLLAQRCRFVDLDSPLLQAEDWPDGMVFDGATLAPPTPRFWG